MRWGGRSDLSNMFLGALATKNRIGTRIAFKCLIYQTCTPHTNTRHAPNPLYRFLLNSRKPDAQHSTSLLFPTLRMTANRTLRLLLARHQERRQGAVWSTGPVQSSHAFLLGCLSTTYPFLGVLHINANYSNPPGPYPLDPIHG